MAKKRSKRVATAARTKTKRPAKAKPKARLSEAGKKAISVAAKKRWREYRREKKAAEAVA